MMAVGAVSGELVSAALGAISLICRENTGKFLEFGLIFPDHPVARPWKLWVLALNSLNDKTGNFFDGTGNEFSRTGIKIGSNRGHVCVTPAGHQGSITLWIENRGIKNQALSLEPVTAGEPVRWAG